jgi:hypothetical protein
MKTLTLKPGVSKLLKTSLAVVMLILVLAGLNGLISSHYVANAAQEVKTLQESVEQAQADYDLSQKQAKDALASYCTNWKELATSKRALADATKLDFNLKQEEIDAVNCTNTQLPSTF